MKNLSKCQEIMAIQQEEMQFLLDWIIIYRQIFTRTLIRQDLSLFIFYKILVTDMPSIHENELQQVKLL